MSEINSKERAISNIQTENLESDAPLTQDKTKKIIESVIEYEKAFSDFFKVLGLKPAQCQLIKAFMMISNGEADIEVSNADLAAVLYDNDASRYDTNRNRVRHSLKVLAEWQEADKIELIRVVQKGQRKDVKGKFEYTKTKYQFELLSDLVKVFHSDSQNSKEAIAQCLEEIKKRYKPVIRAKKYHPRHNLTRAKKTILTKIDRVFNLAIEANLNPADECQKLLNESAQEIGKLVKAWTEEQNQKAFINEFEELMNTNESSNKSKTAIT